MRKTMRGDDWSDTDQLRAIRYTLMSEVEPRNVYWSLNKLDSDGRRMAKQIFSMSSVTVGVNVTEVQDVDCNFEQCYDVNVTVRD